jgi:D-arabinose 1-dehydrogenase-like Zn-dependent alcohol dehydrogenase
MASGNFVLDKGYNAGGEIAKFHAVKYDPAHPETVVPVSSSDDNIAGFAQFGVLTAEIAKGKGASVRVMGITEAVAAGAIDLGDQVQLESDGRVSAAVAASGKRVVGKCVGSASANAGDQISLLIDPVGDLAVTGVTS